jgi:Multisubunit Na+/H+ antiporter, MnhF subunit
MLLFCALIGIGEPDFFKRALFFLLGCALIGLYRVLRGPTAVDRVVAVNAIGMLVIGFCAVVGVATGTAWYIDIAIVWALQSFIVTLTLAKLLEGRRVHD